MSVQLLFAVILILAAMQVSAQQPQEEGVCARVRIKISQEVTITRTAFRATLEVSNNPDNVALQNVNVVLDIRDSNNQPANNLFGIVPPALTNVSDVNGGGSIGPGVTATAVWTIIPTRDAAPDVDTQYSVGGKLTYVEDGQAVTAPLFPATIWVKPDARLFLDYFLVRDVYGDDPFTPEVEPAQSFPLGLMLSNRGKGVANNVRITSSQPQIVDNEKGLLIDFKIIGAQVNTDPASPSLSVRLGNIGPDETTVAKWMMVSSLQGKFISYNATFEHVDGLGDPRLSLIDSVNIHELTHAVRADVPSDDNKPDFLVNDISDESINPNHLPNHLYNSAGMVEPVSVGLFPSVSGAPSQSLPTAKLDVLAPAGWVYVRANDPGGDQYRLARVVRSDNREILVDDNAWTTHRTVRLKGQAPYREHKLHIFDKDSTGSYTLFYEALGPSQTSVGDAKSKADGEQVKLGGSVGLAVTALLNDCIYLESLDRTSGIKVLGASAFEGDRVALEGALATDAHGERYIAASKLTKVGSGMIQPLGTTQRSLWSSDSQYGKGMTGGAGLSMVGLFIRTVGKVISVDTSSFTIDDGSGRGGIKVVLSADASAPSIGMMMQVNGVVSMETGGTGPRPIIRIRRQEDMFAYKQGPRISDLQVTNIRSGSADIGWSTDGQSSSVVKLGAQTGMYDQTINGPDFVQGHMVHVTGLTPNTRYYFIVQSKSYRNDLTSTSAERSFTTTNLALPSLSLAFPTASRTGGTVNATAQLSNTGGMASDIKITAIQTSPASVEVLTQASSVAPTPFGGGSVDGGAVVSRNVQFGTTLTSFYAKLTITYKDGLGAVRALTTPWKKITAP